MRRNWEKKGKAFYYIVAFFFIFILQAFFSLIVNASALYTSIYSPQDPNLTTFDIVGAIVFTIGFLIETFADIQLYQFKKNPENKGKIIKLGIWRYSRHPNYFGESVIWWGIFLISCSLPYGYWTFFSALFITILVRFVSGVPLLEKK